jgi:hypothetical protein
VHCRRELAAARAGVLKESAVPIMYTLGGLLCAALQQAAVALDEPVSLDRARASREHRQRVHDPVQLGLDRDVVQAVEIGVVEACLLNVARAGARDAPRSTIVHVIGAAEAGARRRRGMIGS